ncbi:hypothetical protein KBB06_01785 [Candidatus Gracilibacteria bacterium]|nr:hypothetical protein [Candidatus Gracilibacteria bacterium]
MASKLAKFILKLCSLLLFVAVCYMALFYAYGYKYDEKQKDVKKTSIIDLIGDIKEARVMLNDKIVSNFLPYQIKGLDLGKYIVSVNKTGFQPWKREVAVEADYVTIVNDILLIPEKISDYVKLLKVFNKGDVLQYGKDLIFAYPKDGLVIHLVNLYGDGTVRDEDLELAQGEISKVDNLGSDRFLVDFNDGQTSYFDFPERSFVTFNKPERSYGYRLSPDSKMLYFFIGEDLYRAPMAELLLEGKMQIEKYFLHKSVQAVSFGFNGDIYFISGGVAYRTDSAFGKLEPLMLSLKRYKNLDCRNGRDYAILTMRDDDGGRSLYVIDKKGRSSLMTDELKGLPYLNEYDQLVFVEKGQTSTAGHIFYYDPILKIKSLVRDFSGELELFGWFSNEGHFVFKEAGTVYLSDVFNANSYVLLKDGNLERIFVFSHKLFYVKEGKLYGLNWKDSF